MASVAACASTKWTPSTVASLSETQSKRSRIQSLRISKLSSFSGLKASASSLQLRKLQPADSLSKVVSAATKQNRQRGSKGVVTCGSGMNIIFVSAEVAPWSKTGGLGDVVGGLPPALAARGHRVMTICPRYDQYKDAWDTDTTADVKVGNKIETVRFFHTYKRGVDRVFIDHPLFLAKVWGKTGSKIYGPKSGTDYADNQLRFSLFNQAALEAPRILHLNSSDDYSGPYGEDVVFLANDWHTSLLPCYLKYVLQPQGIYKNAKVAFCVHNIAYQGRFALDDFGYLNLPDSAKPSFEFMDGYVKPVKGKKINWCQAGFLESDKVFTVSPNYALELTSGPAKGVELDNIVLKTGIKGIVNGMDVQEWDPLEDKYLDVPYSAETVTAGKAAAKEALQAEVGLPVDPSVPVLAFIGRLEEQKGSDILEEALADILEEDVQVIVLGTGKKYMEEQLETLEVKYPTKARGVVKFNVPLAHLMTGGADFMLVPSRFEPCGLIQLHAMRYGTVPIVASTGGLVDTVIEGETGFHVGEFNVDCDAVDPLDVAALVKGVKKALKVYKTPQFAQMVQNCMAQDLSWKEPARKWEAELLALGSPGEAGAEGDEVGPKAKENIAAP